MLCSVIVFSIMSLLHSAFTDLCFFLDVFNSFIDYKGYRDDRLFAKLNLEKPDIHPNKRGLGVLARRYIFIIRTKFRFNPLGY